MVNFLALPRVIMAIAADGLIFEIFARVHPKFKTPFYGTLIAGLLTGFMACFFDLSQLINMMSIGTVLKNFYNPKSFLNTFSFRFSYSLWHIQLLLHVLCFYDMKLTMKNIL
jgi:amino acid transporter